MKALFQTLVDAKKLDYDIGYRGGYCGGYCGALAEDVITFAAPDSMTEEDKEEALASLPGKVGVYCNYLGGGLRGSLVDSAIGKLPDDRPWSKELFLTLDAFQKDCRAFYNECERENGLQDEVDADGETNWDNIGTNASRKAGIVSAY